MLTKKTLGAWVGVIILCLMALSACASSAPSTGSSGLKAGPGIDTVNKTITVGILSPYSGPVAGPVGIPLANGVKLFFQDVNASGGIDGYKVKFLEEDTKYDPQTEVQLYNQIHNKVAMIVDSLGTAPTFAIQSQSAADHMLVEAATLSSALARSKYLFLTGTPYRLQVENAFDYVVNTLKVSNPATGIIYQNDDYGQDGLTGYKESISAYHLNDVGQASFAPTDTDLTAQVSQMKAGGAKYVFLSTLPTVTATIIGTAAKLNYFPQFILQSPAWSNQLAAVPALKPLISRLWLMGQGAVWGDTSVPGMVRLLADVKKFLPNQGPDGFLEAGFGYTYVAYAILKKALDNKDITRDGLYNAFISLKSVDSQGIYPPVTYGASPNQRVPTRDNVVFQIDPTALNDVKVLTPDFTGTAAKASNF